MALLSAPPLAFVTRILGPIPRLLILIGNAITPGRGFREGPFSTETELRELVDMAEASAVIESGERKMIHSVFELGDTIAREVMVPRNDVVYIEHYKNLRQTMSLFLRSGYSRIPVIGENLDDVLGFAYLKDVVRRDFEAARRGDHPAGRGGDAAGACTCPTPSRSTTCSRRCRRSDSTSRWSSTSTAAPPAWSPSRTSSRRSSARSPTSTTRTEIEVEVLEDGTARVSSRYPVDDLDELFGFHVDDEDVDSVGGLMAKYLGRVPIAGSARRGPRPAVRGRGALGPAQPDRHRPDHPGRGRGPSPTTTGAAMPDLSAEDAKLVTLARATRARVGAAEGAAVRDGDGRTYAGATVDLPSLRVSALQVCVAMAVASGSRGLEAAVVLPRPTASPKPDLAAIPDLAGDSVVVHLADPRGTVRQSHLSA